MERTIRITGKGKLSVKSDMIRLRINIEGTYEEYDETLRRSSDCVGILKDLIGVCQVKCVSFFLHLFTPLHRLKYWQKLYRM